MNPHELLDAARTLAASGTEVGSRAVRQEYLRRAASTLYYALFHCLSRSNADMLVGDSSVDRKRRSWIQIYRSLSHAEANKRCKATEVTRFPMEIQEFANLFCTAQEERIQADYNPESSFSAVWLQMQIVAARSAIQAIYELPSRDRRAFAVYLLFDKRVC